MLTAEDVAKELGVSKGHAYKLIRELNGELKKAGYLVIAGKACKRNQTSAEAVGKYCGRIRVCDCPYRSHE